MNVIRELADIAGKLDRNGRTKLADRLDRVIGRLSKRADKGSFVFPSSHSKVKSGNHFPIDTEGRARNALARANQYDKAPDWYDGALQELVDTVVREVKKKYPSIEISEKSKNPGKG